MDITLTERDTLGYGGLLLVAISVCAVFGFWTSIGVVGCMLMALGCEKK